jgi:type I restriction enzyme M protein
MNSAFKDIEKLESDLWEAADNLRANSKLTSSDYFMPVLGVIFLRHAANRFEAAEKQIEADRASGKMPKRNAAENVARRLLDLVAIKELRAPSSRRCRNPLAPRGSSWLCV